jgi:hypothetical protein
MSEDLNVEFLGCLPLDPLLARCCDEGKNVLIEMANSPAILDLKIIVQSNSFNNLLNKFLYLISITITQIFFIEMIQKCEGFQE